MYWNDGDYSAYVAAGTKDGSQDGDLGPAEVNGDLELERQCSQQFEGILGDDTGRPKTAQSADNVGDWRVENFGAWEIKILGNVEYAI